MNPTNQVHSTADEETKNLLEFYPPHPPRTSTPEYNATHILLTHTLNMPCRDCGVRLTTIGNPTLNPKGAKQIETHHWPLQREFADAIDPLKVQKEYPEVTDRDSLNKFIDSPKNMLVLCDVDHRSPTQGIHHIGDALEACKRFIIDGYILDDVASKAQADMAQDALETANEPVNEEI